MSVILRYERGWTGIFTRCQAPQAQFANGTRITKVKTEETDKRPVGATGTVLGSVYLLAKGVCYFVEWDTAPRVAVAIIGWKIGELLS